MMMTSFERIKTYALHARRKLRTTYFVILGFTAIIIFYLTATAYAQSTTSFALPWFTVSNGGGSSSGGSYELYDSINQSGLGEMKGGAFAISDGFQVTSTPTPTSTRTENPERPTPTPTNTPTTGPKLELAKSVSQNVAQANDLLTYQVVVTATHDTAMIELSDVLTNGLTYVENSVSENARVEHDTIRYTGSVLPDNPLTIHYQARVAADIEPGRTLNNRVVVTNTSNNQRLDDTVIVSVPSTPTISSLVLLYVNADNIAGGPADLSWHIRQLIRRVHRGAAALGDADASVEIFMVLDWYGDRNSRLFHVSKESNGNCDLFTDFTCNGLYELGKSVTPFDERLGDPTSLTKLIVTGLNAYPNAEQVLLSLVGHGGGWSPLLLAGQPTSHYGQSGLGGLLWDDTPGTSLSTIELGAALKAAFAATGRKIDLLYLDACLMGMYEVAYEIKDSVNYLLASASWAWTSFAYDAHLRALKTPQPADEIAQMWMQNEASILRPDNLPFTYSVVDLKQMDTLKLAIDRLAKSLIVLTTDEVDRVRIATAAKATDCFDSNQDIMITQADTYCDLMSFTRKLNELFAGNAEVVDAIRNVQTALPKVVVDKDQQNGKPNRFASEQWEWDSPGGLAIYLPLREDEWKRRYYKNRDDEDGLLFAKDGEWDDFIQLYWGEKEPPDDPPCPPCQVQPGHLEILQKFYQPILLR